jgi:hypothetical protein
MEEKLPDVPNNNTNALIRRLVDSFYSHNQGENVVDLFINDSRYLTLQATIFVLSLVPEIPNISDNTLWVTTIFAIAYLRSFLNLNGNITEKRINQIMDMFEIEH